MSTLLQDIKKVKSSCRRLERGLIKFLLLNKLINWMDKQLKDKK